MRFWRNSVFAAETVAIFVALTSLCVAILALNRSPLDDPYLNLVNAGIAALLAGMVTRRYILAARAGLARTGWIVAGIALSLYAAAQFFEGQFEAIGRTLNLEDKIDVAVLLVLPVAVLAAGWADRIGRSAMLLLAAAAIGQVASSGLDLFEDQIAATDAFTFHGADVLADVSEFIFLQLYLIALAVAALPKAAGREPAPEAQDPKATMSEWLKRRGLTPKRFRSWHIDPILWRLRNPDGTPEDYYAGRIRRQIGRGLFHPAIGPTARSVRANSELLDVLQAHGLESSHTVVDYGCGSFRLGAPVIEYLEPGKYWGLDVIQDFLTMGMELLAPELAAKRPNALVINEANLAQARAAAPDFVISWHVCSKVPPQRLPDYFGKIVSLMGPTTLALVHFPETERRKRQSRFSWSQSRETITEVLRSIDPSLEIRFAPVTEKVARGVRQTMVLVRRS